MLNQTSNTVEVGYRLARIDEDFYLDRYATDASSKDYTTTTYQVPSIHTEDGIIGISDNKGYLKLFNIQQNEYAIYKLFVESEGGVIALNTPWKQFKFISNNQLSTPRTYKSRILFENEEDEPPCYHGCPGYKICFLQQNSNKVFYSIVHFGKTYYENDSLYARSTNVFGCAQHQDQITCFDIENNFLVTGSVNGDIKVWIHKEESIEANQDESFELAWTLKGIHKKQFLQNVAIVIPTSGYSANPFIVSGGGPDGILLIHDIESQQSLQQIVLESSPLSLMKEFVPSSSLIACNQLVFSMKKETRINVKNSIPLPGSHLVACDKDGRGHVWMISEIINQIIKRDQHGEIYDEDHELLDVEYNHNDTSFSEPETPRPHTISKQMDKYHLPEETSEYHPNADYSSDEDALSDVTSVRSSLSSISLPREVRYVPKPTRNPSSEKLNPTIPHTMDQMLWSQEFVPESHSRTLDRVDIDDIDRNRDILTPEPQIISIQKSRLPTKKSSPILKTHSLPNFNESSIDEDSSETPQINENIPKPIITREPSPKDSPKPIDPTLQSPTNESKPPTRRRIKPETTKTRSPSNIPSDDPPKKPINSNEVKPNHTPLKKSSSSSQVKIVNHLNAEPSSQDSPFTQSEPKYNIPAHTPAIVPNSSRRIEYKLYQKQTEQFNEDAARQVLIKENALFTKNEAEKLLNYTPGESMFGVISVPDKVDNNKNYDVVETKLRKQVSKKHLKEVKERPNIMDLYVKEDWEKEVTLEQTGPRTIYSLDFDQFGDVIPHPRAEYESIKKFLKENPII